MTYYKPIKELKVISETCCNSLPPLEDHHLEVLEQLEIKKGNAMNTNKTAFFIQEIHRYCKEQKVLRTAHMGETRGGKTEGAEMTSLVQTHFFNKLLSEGHYDNVDVEIPKKEFVFGVKNIHRNKTYYLEYMRNGFKNGTLQYGEVNQIDENEDATGGLGSMSQEIELKNYNNIVAKYNLSEHWIDPRRFTEMNTSYGIHWFIKDVKNRRNWGLLYRLENWSYGINPQSFIGWVCFPLHENQELRADYEKKKNAWIDEVIAGGGDVRARIRLEAAEIVAKDKNFSMMKTSKSFVLTNDQQLDIIDRMITEGKLTSFNAEERVRIMGSAQLIVKRERFPELYTGE